MAWKEAETDLKMCEKRHPADVSRNSFALPLLMLYSASANVTIDATGERMQLRVMGSANRNTKMQSGLQFTEASLHTADSLIVGHKYLSSSR